jgi:uncharacterized protein YaaQ
MKLILAIISADAVDPVSRVLVEHKYAVTQVSSIGGFLRRGNATLVIGVNESQVEEALSILRQACAPFRPSTPESHCATIFVLDAAQFVQI